MRNQPGKYLVSSQPTVVLVQTISMLKMPIRDDLELGLLLLDGSNFQKSWNILLILEIAQHAPLDEVKPVFVVSL